MAAPCVRACVSLTSAAERGSFDESTARPRACCPFIGAEQPTPNGCHSHDTFVFIGHSTNISPETPQQPQHRCPLLILQPAEHLTCALLWLFTCAKTFCICFSSCLESTAAGGCSLMCSTCATKQSRSNTTVYHK